MCAVVSWRAAAQLPGVNCVVLANLPFLPAPSLFRKGMRCSRIWWTLSIVHSSLEPTCAQASAQRRMDNNLDCCLNNAVFIKPETCPNEEKQKIEFWWLRSIHLGTWVDYLMRMDLPFFTWWRVMTPNNSALCTLLGLEPTPRLGNL